MRCAMPCRKLCSPALSRTEPARCGEASSAARCGGVPPPRATSEGTTTSAEVEVHPCAGRGARRADPRSACGEAVLLTTLLLTTLLLTTHSLAAHDRTTVLPTRCTLVIYLYLLDSPEINQIVLVSYSLTTAIDLWKVWRCSASALT